MDELVTILLSWLTLAFVIVMTVGFVIAFWQAMKTPRKRRPDDGGSESRELEWHERGRP